jgi:amidase
MAVATVDHVVSREDVIWAFGPDLEPILEVDPGAIVRIETNDCFSGQIRSEDDLVTSMRPSRRS